MFLKSDKKKFGYKSKNCVNNFIWIFLIFFLIVKKNNLTPYRMGNNYRLSMIDLGFFFSKNLFRSFWSVKNAVLLKGEKFN